MSNMAADFYVNIYSICLQSFVMFNTVTSLNQSFAKTTQPLRERSINVFFKTHIKE